MPSAGPYTDGVPEVWTSHEGSMARETAHTRWPGIVQDMIRDAERNAETAPEAQKAEASSIVRSLAQLKNDIVNDAPLK